MTKLLQCLINTLRDELQQYGEMLALLEQQQETEKLRGVEDLLLSLSCVSAQSVKIQAARERRRALQTELASMFQPEQPAPFNELIPHLPEEYRPLFSALIQENNELLDRVRERARQSQILFQRSTETLQRFLSSLTAHDQTPTAEYTQVPAGSPEVPLTWPDPVLNAPPYAHPLPQT